MTKNQNLTEDGIGRRISDHDFRILTQIVLDEDKERTNYEIMGKPLPEILSLKDNTIGGYRI
jgi:hypothetical protein